MTDFTILPERYDGIVQEAQGRLPDIGDKEEAVTTSVESLRTGWCPRRSARPWTRSGG